MCCEPEGGHGVRGAWAYTCCCGPGHVVFVRHFPSSKEEQERLEKYKDELKKELTGVEEQIEKLKGK